LLEGFEDPLPRERADAVFRGVEALRLRRPRPLPVPRDEARRRVARTRIGFGRAWRGW